MVQRMWVTYYSHSVCIQNNISNMSGISPEPYFHTMNTWIFLAFDQPIQLNIDRKLTEMMIYSGVNYFFLRVYNLTKSDPDSLWDTLELEACLRGKKWAKRVSYNFTYWKIFLKYVWKSVYFWNAQFKIPNGRICYIWILLISGIRGMFEGARMGETGVI